MFIWPDAQTQFLSGVEAPAEFRFAWYFIFRGDEILTRLDESGNWKPVDESEGPPEGELHYMGALGRTECFAIEVVDMPGEEFGGLRSLFGRADHLMFSLAGRGLQIIEWYRTHRFCGKCGGRTREHERDRAMVCDACGLHLYPRLSPSIIVLIHKDDRVLLARNHRFPEGMYSTLAGFVEPGESVEETLRREVMEEVGATLGRLEYLGSQPWPFPNSLMLGFHAEYESGDIVLQEDEIADAGWFPCGDLPNIPGKVAISRWLIDAYLQKRGYEVDV